MIASTAKGRTSRQRDRHGDLIAAAMTVFSEKGVSAASVDDIVQSAGVAKGTFYLYFATKDEDHDRGRRTDDRRRRGSDRAIGQRARPLARGAPWRDRGRALPAPAGEPSNAT